MHFKFPFRLITLYIIFFFSACDAAVIDSENGENTPVIEKSQADTRAESSTSKNDIKHTLWKVKGKQNTVYLLGSIHFMKPELYPLPNPYYEAFDDAEKLVFEIDLSIQDPALIQQSVMKYALLPKGTSLEETIGKEKYLEIRALAKKNKIPMLSIEPFDPWMTVLALAATQYVNAGLSPESGIDQHFMQKGQEAGKPISGFETIDYQFNMFDSMSMETQVEMLVEILKNEIDIQKFVDQLIEDWQEGDMQGLEDLVMEEFKESDEMYNAVLVTRNHNWLKQMQPMLEDTDDYLIVVGAAHMLGDDGMIKLLENQGHIVEQL